MIKKGTTNEDDTMRNDDSGDGLLDGNCDGDGI
jgi:hypothetical protein